VLYVLSSGRSGSTLLELLLGTHPEIESAGEAQLLGFTASAPNGTCRCGFPLERCPVWSGVLGADDGSARTRELGRFRESRNAGRTLRPELLLEVLAGRLGPEGRTHAAAYATTSFAFLDAVADRRTRYVVDASKDLYRLHWLAKGSQREVRVLLLTRDPRAFVWSSAGRRATSLVTTLRLAARWSVQQLLMTRWLRASGTPWMLVRYEDLVTDPPAALRAIERWLRVDPDRFVPADLFERRGHGVAGNPMQFREGQITFDDEWRDRFARSPQRIVWAVAGVPARRLGYRWRSRW
jgi:hypothetical protein